MTYRPNKAIGLIAATCAAAIMLAGAMAFAQSDTGATATSHKKRTAQKPASIASQIEQMRQQFQQQQQEIDQLKQQLQDRDQKLQQAQQTAQQAAAEAQAARQSATQSNPSYTDLQQAVQKVRDEAQQNIQGVKADTQQIKTDTQDLKSSLEEVRQNDEGMRLNVANPLAIGYKGVYITPGGYLAAETALRQGATGGGIGTPFNSIPFSKSALGQQSEFIATAQQSRITLAVEGKLNTATVGGYYETDFLGTGPSSNPNESNSYNLRLRQVWARYQNVNGWTLVGGQMWSFLTATTVGMENRYEAIPYTIDANYAPGFIWTRQYAIRAYKNMLDKKMFAGLALENPQTTFAGQGYTNNFILGVPGNPGGQFNPAADYSLNMAPDVIAKVAFEPGFGHYEVAGIATFLRDRVYPNAGTKSATGAHNDSKVAGGVEGAAWLPFHKGMYNLGVRGMYGQSLGRYGAGGLPDSTVHPDGTLAPLHNVVGMFSAELHPGRWDIYDYYGGTTLAAPLT